MKYYLVSAVGYEYNDNTYDRLGRVKAEKLYKSQEEAVAEARLLNRKEYSRNPHILLYGSFADYYYDQTERMQILDQVADLCGISIDAELFWEAVIPENLSDEVFDKVLNLLDIRFYEVEEVELVEG